MRRYHSAILGAQVVSIVVGDCVVSADPGVVITTTLGSCIAACLFDPEAAIGGMNHFLLPDAGLERVSVSARYGSAAMERLINKLLARTGRRDRLRAKLFGGARMNGLRSDVGQRNIRFVERYLATEGIEIVNSDVGGNAARAVRFYPATGRSLRRLIGEDQVRDVMRSEDTYLERLRSRPIDGDVELF